ncbi:DUF4180 domain-containing protein [Peribacillus frigoritolerans]|nr:DUF4180 domain-containing protein [Peribacillus frigoritolerans]
MSEDFFKLTTKLAGGILQKFANYQINHRGFFILRKISLYECNKGNNVYFVPSEQEAIDKLSKEL